MKGSPFITRYRIDNKETGRVSFTSFREKVRGYYIGLMPYEDETAKLTRLSKCYQLPNGRILKRKQPEYKLSIMFCDGECGIEEELMAV